MNQHNDARGLRRWWTAVVEASAAAVAIHYAAPWRDRGIGPRRVRPHS